MLSVACSGARTTADETTRVGCEEALCSSEGEKYDRWRHSVPSRVRRVPHLHSRKKVMAIWPKWEHVAIQKGWRYRVASKDSGR